MNLTTNNLTIQFDIIQEKRIRCEKKTGVVVLSLKCFLYMYPLSVHFIIIHNFVNNDLLFIISWETIAFSHKQVEFKLGLN